MGDSDKGIEKAMSGHHPWPPSSAFTGKLHDDLQQGKREVFRLGEWSIYDCSGVGGVINAHWSSFIMHCARWTEKRRIAQPLTSTTWYKDRDAPVEVPKSFPMEEITVRCNTNMTAERFGRCPGCHAHIPDEVQALWKLQNMDQIQELANNA